MLLIKLIRIGAVIGPRQLYKATKFGDCNKICIKDFIHYRDMCRGDLLNNSMNSVSIDSNYDFW